MRKEDVMPLKKVWIREATIDDFSNIPAIQKNMPVKLSLPACLLFIDN